MRADMGSIPFRPIDLHVGRRARERRQELRLSCEMVAKVVSLPVQTIENFEAGFFRLEPVKLADVAAVLLVPLCYFYGEAKQGETWQGLEISRLQAFGPRLTPSKAQELQENAGREEGHPLWMISEVRCYFYAFAVTEDGVGSGWLAADSLTKLRQYLPSGLVRSDVQPSETPGLIEIWVPAG
jgi:hypothetical protein